MHETRVEFLAPGSFEWDENKSKANLHKHGFDFDDASQALYGPVMLYRSDRNNEERWTAIGSLDGRFIAVILTRRQESVRIISRRDAPGAMKKEHIVTRKWGDRRKGNTDWARVDAMTDAEIEAAIASDPDWAEFKDIDWSNAVVVMPVRKKAISIRIDEDVLDFFKGAGEGYQRRMNAVLRSYMQQKSKPKRRA